MSRFNSEKFAIDETNIRPRSSRDYPVAPDTFRPFVSTIVGDDQDVITSTNFNRPHIEYTRDEKKRDYFATNFEADFVNTVPDEIAKNTRVENKEYAIMK